MNYKYIEVISKETGFTTQRIDVSKETEPMIERVMDTLNLYINHSKVYLDVNIFPAEVVTIEEFIKRQIIER